MYSIQQNLFSFEEWLQLDSKDRLPLFFSALELTPYAKALASASPQGRNGTCKQSTLRALLAAHMEGITTFTALHKRLDNDLRFRYQCGFPLNEAPPSISTISRVFKKLIKKKLAERLFNDLVI
ncbi:transposase, partial [Fictibacillus sp. NRS-1165]|uniref:transposase n=1 Tax=Fictibacillus sp. NRS-1165 TaxID=3144463 RepID=UPI003D19A655